MTEKSAPIDNKLFEILETVSDPEIPVLSIMEMGVVRSAKLINNVVEVEITPTYSGCPAMDVIGDDIIKAFKNQGFEAKVKLILSPAWTTDWITPKGRMALEKYGIASPLNEEADKDALLGNKKIVKCPQCGSLNTKLISQFEDCLEPFDYFKCLK